MTVQEFFMQPMVFGAMIGLTVGLFLCLLLLASRLKAWREVRRYRKMLDDKSKMEKEHLELYQADKSRLDDDKKKLAESNENLRKKITQMKSSSETIRARDVEIMARAEKRLMANSPSFSIAWEDAKNAAALELDEEEQGKRETESFFRRFIPTRNGMATEPTKTLETSETFNA